MIRFQMCLAAAIAAASLTLRASAQSPWTDDFNRPNSTTNLGPDWTYMNGNFGINANRGYNNTPWDHGIAIHNSATGSYDAITTSIDFLPLLQPPPLHYIGLCLGLKPNWECICIMVQDNDGDGLYDRVFFWSGVNAGNSWASPSNFDLAVPTASGRMTCYITNNGDVANLDIDRDFNGSVDEHFELAGILAANYNLGTGVGIASYGTPLFDNWVASDGSAAGPQNYCTPGTTTSGCTPMMAWSGTPSASATSGFLLQCNGLEGAKTGIFFYGVNGPQATAWGTGTSFLCVKAPTQRTPTQGTGGTLNACDGAMSLDLLAFLAANPLAVGQPITAGQVLHAQTWFRDPPAPKTTNLSDGLQITLVP